MPTSARSRRSPVLAGLGLVALALTVGALVPRPLRRRDGGGANEILLVATNAAHVDIALPATPEVRRRLAFLAGVGIRIADPRLSHVLVGWGGRGFYPNNGQPWRISPRTWVESVVADESVLRFDAAADLGGRWRGHRRLRLSDAGLSAMLDFIEDTLERDADGSFRPLDHPGVNRTDHFFKAHPTFTAFAGCNVWVSEALAAAGVPSGRWTPLPQPLFASLRWHRAAERLAPDGGRLQSSSRSSSSPSSSSSRSHRQLRQSSSSSTGTRSLR